MNGRPVTRKSCFITRVSLLVAVMAGLIAHEKCMCVGDVHVRTGWVVVSMRQSISAEVQLDPESALSRTLCVKESFERQSDKARLLLVKRKS